MLRRHAPWIHGLLQDFEPEPLLHSTHKFSPNVRCSSTFQHCNSVTRDVAYSSRPLRWVAAGGDGRLLPASSHQTSESPQILRFRSILLSTVKLSTSAKCGPSPNNNISTSLHQSEPLFFSFKHFLMEVAQYQNI
eukprot:Gb_38896 [translate_table: standard]